MASSDFRLSNSLFCCGKERTLGFDLGGQRRQVLDAFLEPVLGSQDIVVVDVLADRLVPQRLDALVARGDLGRQLLHHLLVPGQLGVAAAQLFAGALNGFRTVGELGLERIDDAP